MINLLMLFSLLLSPNTPATQPIELGDVQWMRDFDEGVKKAEQLDKPIFLLFQEVPGCGTCQRYGQEVLRHPLVVEAIETLFVPVAIYNNKGGADKKVLQHYGEPAWNNPVVRIVDANKYNIIPRVAGNYSVAAVVQGMVIALYQTQNEIPEYLKLLNAELNPQGNVETAFLSMYCFWTGEKKIAAIDGVVETQPGFMNGREVVKVKYDTRSVDFTDLVSSAKEQQCASQVYTETENQKKAAGKVLSANDIADAKAFRLDSEPKYYLSKTTYRFVPMTQLQAAKVNSAIGSGQSPDTFLSTAQLKVLQQIKNNPKGKWKSAINVPLMTAWKNIGIAR